jgi:hypothetical protein
MRCAGSPMALLPLLLWADCTWHGDEYEYEYARPYARLRPYVDACVTMHGERAMCDELVFRCVSYLSLPDYLLHAIARRPPLTHRVRRWDWRLEERWSERSRTSPKCSQSFVLLACAHL